MKDVKEIILNKNITFERKKKGGRTAHINIEIVKLKKPTRNYVDLSPVDISQSLAIRVDGNIRAYGSGQITEKFEEVIPFFAKSNIDCAKKIAYIWREYHLNDFQPGTKAQMEVLKKNPHIYEECDGIYDREKEILANENLLTDRGYTYGTDWLYKPVPQEIIDFIYSL